MVTLGELCSHIKVTWRSPHTLRWGHGVVDIIIKSNICIVSYEVYYFRDQHIKLLKLVFIINFLLNLIFFKLSQLWILLSIFHSEFCKNILNHCLFHEIIWFFLKELQQAYSKLSNYFSIGKKFFYWEILKKPSIFIFFKLSCICLCF